MLEEREFRDALGNSGRFFGHESYATDVARSFPTKHYEGAEEHPARAQQRFDTFSRQDLRDEHLRHIIFCDT